MLYLYDTSDCELNLLEPEKQLLNASYEVKTLTRTRTRTRTLTLTRTLILTLTLTP